MKCAVETVEYQSRQQFDIATLSSDASEVRSDDLSEAPKDRFIGLFAKGYRGSICGAINQTMEMGVIQGVAGQAGH